MNRRDFSLFAGSALLAVPGLAKSNTNRPSRQDRSFKSVGNSLRVITAKDPLNPRSLYGLHSQSSLSLSLRANGSGRAEGRSVRIISAVYDKSFDLSTIPALEVTEWFGEFEYQTDGDVVSIYYQSQSSGGQFNEGQHQGKTFEEEFVDAGDEPHLIGYFSKNHQNIVFSTPKVLTKRVLISGGVEQITRWNYNATALRCME